MKRLYYALTLGFLGLPQLAAAERNGATFGGELTLGHLDCQTADGDNCSAEAEVNAAYGLSLHGGLMITPRLALLGEAWGMRHQKDRLTITQGLLTAGVRAWVAPRLWLGAGLGVAQHEATFDLSITELSNKSDYVPAATATIGLEVISLGAIKVDVALKAGTGLYNDDLHLYNVSLALGLSAY